MDYNFNIRIEELTIGISCTHELTKLMCTDYIVENSIPDFSVKADKKTMEKLRKFFLGFSGMLSEDFIENNAILDKICTNVIAYNAAFFHAALISIDGNGIAFAAPSGTGKSTHIILWKKLFADRVEIINGDKPLLSFRNGLLWASGTPWCGKEGWYVNKTVPVKAICFVERCDKNSIVPLLDSREIMRRIFHQLIFPEGNQELMTTYLSFANKLINTVPFYLLSCNMLDDAALTAYNGIFGEQL